MFVNGNTFFQYKWPKFRNSRRRHKTNQTHFYSITQSIQISNVSGMFDSFSRFMIEFHHVYGFIGLCHASSYLFLCFRIGVLNESSNMHTNTGNVLKIRLVTYDLALRAIAYPVLCLRSSLWPFQTSPNECPLSYYD